MFRSIAATITAVLALSVAGPAHADPVDLPPAPLVNLKGASVLGTNPTGYVVVQRTGLVQLFPPRWQAVQGCGGQVICESLTRSNYKRLARKARRLGTWQPLGTAGR